MVDLGTRQKAFSIFGMLLNGVVRRTKSFLLVWLSFEIGGGEALIKPPDPVRSAKVNILPFDLNVSLEEEGLRFPDEQDFQTNLVSCNDPDGTAFGRTLSEENANETPQRRNLGTCRNISDEIFPKNQEFTEDQRGNISLKRKFHNSSLMVNKPLWKINRPGESIPELGKNFPHSKNFPDLSKSRIFISSYKSKNEIFKGYSPDGKICKPLGDFRVQIESKKRRKNKDMILSSRGFQETEEFVKNRKLEQSNSKHSEESSLLEFERSNEEDNQNDIEEGIIQGFSETIKVEKWNFLILHPPELDPQARNEVSKIENLLLHSIILNKGNHEKDDELMILTTIPKKYPQKLLPEYKRRRILYSSLIKIFDREFSSSENLNLIYNIEKELEINFKNKFHLKSLWDEKVLSEREQDKFIHQLVQFSESTTKAAVVLVICTLKYLSIIKEIENPERKSNEILQFITSIWDDSKTLEELFTKEISGSSTNHKFFEFFRDFIEKFQTNKSDRKNTATWFCKAWFMALYWFEENWKNFSELKFDISFFKKIVIPSINRLLIFSNYKYFCEKLERNSH